MSFTPGRVDDAVQRGAVQAIGPPAQKAPAQDCRPVITGQSGRRQCPLPHLHHHLHHHPHPRVFFHLHSMSPKMQWKAPFMGGTSRQVCPSVQICRPGSPSLFNSVSMP